MSARKVRLPTVSTLYPNSVRPGHGIFVETRRRELLRSGEVEVRVVAPIPWSFSTDPRYGDYARMLSQRGGGAFAQAISALLASSPDRAQVRSYAEYFSWQSTTDAQLALFQKIALKCTEAIHA
ncbi:MAG: hypothetical protein KJ614_00940 [Gammaproteobacteria bacterium]|uniref:hypothetical protein n=1 Tax=Rhodoferax sp. TaxID=50421 RepID=UPI001DA79BBC|nr:hypothetical protein [Rhodoferax sp.]MBU3897489.1 hypothetical protein [Gammaproteobacteria bacterium]MBU3996199.1 hypothetical protein [Gammaproteobacteria bacterium]MBU4018835.1 hypothetical protein [Gammaproteobacteria bacterium]MBU4079790.1 hypothetical protein [Gammaproteobacteria bacterium]MBU4115139.1 hypothetical protein [Gammaproteobacteria bacterium]